MSQKEPQLEAKGATGRMPLPPATTESRLVRYVLTGIAVVFLGLFIVLPVANVFAQAFSHGFSGYVGAFVPQAPTPSGTVHTVTQIAKQAAKQRSIVEKNWRSIRLSLAVAAVVIPVNVVFGLAAAWAIGKFRFRGRNILMSLIDLPFSVSPVVVGLMFVLLLGDSGLFGRWASGLTLPDPFSVHWAGFGESWFPLAFGNHFTGVIFTPVAIVLASLFVTFPFVPRSLIPLMEAQGTDEELAAISLGASGWQTFRRVTLPNIKWGLLYGVILATARCLGEFGAVSVVTGNTDSNATLPLRIENLWSSYHYQPAFALASVLTLISVVTLVAKVLLERQGRSERS